MIYLTIVTDFIPDLSIISLRHSEKEGRKGVGGRCNKKYIGAIGSNVQVVTRITRIY